MNTMNNEHTSVTVLPTTASAQPPRIPAQGRTAYDSHHTTSHTSRTFSKDSDDSNCCTTLFTCLGGTIGVLVLVALLVSTLCFFVSGVVFTAEEYSDIPDCAKAYRGWSIAMVVIYGLCALGSKNAKDGFQLDLGDGSVGKVLGGVLLIFAIFPGLIAGLGNRDVLQHPPANCDLSEIDSLVVWTRWVVYYNWVLMGLLLFGGVVSCIFG